MGMFHPKGGETDAGTSDPTPSHVSVSQFEINNDAKHQSTTALSIKRYNLATASAGAPQKPATFGTRNLLSVGQDHPSGLMSSQWSRAANQRGLQHQPQVVISVKCSKAMTIQNYNALAKMVGKQRRTSKPADGGYSDSNMESNNNSNSKSFHAKQKMLESRIEKLRSLESKIQSDTVCTKKTCPSSVDPRTTQERYGNDSTVSTGETREMQDRIERFKASQFYKNSQSAQKMNRNNEGKQGLFKLNAEDRDIKISAADEVNFNFMRRHQVVEESADIDLSVLIKQNQDRAVRNMIKSKEKMRRKQSTRNNTTLATYQGQANTHSSYGMQSCTFTQEPDNYQSHNVLRQPGIMTRTPSSNTATNAMARTFTTQMTAQSRNQNNRITKSSFSKHSVNTFQNTAGGRIGTTPTGSRRYIQQHSTQSNRLQYGRTAASKAASVETLRKAYENIARSPSPELEKKDDFMAQSLWKVAAKSNQEDFKELFKNRTQLESSEDMERKLRDLINNQKHKPTLEPDRQVSPRTIKFLCNMLLSETPQHQVRNLNTESASALNGSTRWPQNPATSSQISQAQISQKRPGPRTIYGSETKTTNARNYFRNKDPEEVYDPNGKTAEMCRPLLKDHKEKLLEILQKSDKKENVKQGRGNSENNNRRDIRQDLVSQYSKSGAVVQKTVAELMKLQEDHNASPTRKAKPKITTKNEIQELVESQFPSKQTKQATMFGRAMDIYNTHKERNGYSQNLIFKPEQMTHFHIETFGDNIESNHYQNGVQPGKLNIGSHLTNSNATLSGFKPLPFQKRENYRSQYDLDQIEEVKKDNEPIKIQMLPKTTTQVDIHALRQSSYRSSRRGGEDSPDSVFSSHMEELNNLTQVLNESPEIPMRRKPSKRMSNLHKIMVPTIGQQEKQPRKQKLSVLLTKEVPTEQEYFTKIDLSLLTKLDRQTAIMAYKTLKVALNPVFSGSLDHRINMLDPKKALSLLDLGADKVRQQVGSGLKLLQELKFYTDQLNDKQIFHGYWDCINDAKGSLPDARKGTTMNLIKNQLYVFGGFSRSTFNDLKVYDLTLNRWEEAKTEQSRVIPEPRHSHTMINYNDKLVLFGGAGAFLQNLHMMPSYNDIWELNTATQTWSKLEGSGIPPKKRMQHVAATMGSLMLIHGGYNCEGKITLDDFNLFDVEEYKWIKTKIIMNGKVVVSGAQYGSTIDTDDDDAHKINTIGARMGHCIATVLPHTSDRFSSLGPKGQYTATFGQAKRDIFKRGMWIHERNFSKEEISKGRDFKEGFYMFGGENRDGVILNDLWLIRPEFYTNKRMIDDVKYKYTCKDPELTLNVQQITNYSGQAPCPRFGAGMIHINLKKQGHQILIIYGGRNDKIYSQTGSVALNDICIFNINLMQWEALAMFGQLPMARWKHSMVAHYDEQLGSTGLMIFGGLNMHCYCKSNLYTFTLINKKRGNKARPNTRERAKERTFQESTAQGAQKDDVSNINSNNYFNSGQSQNQVHFGRKPSSRQGSLKQRRGSEEPAKSNLKSNAGSFSTAAVKIVDESFGPGSGGILFNKEAESPITAEAGRLRLGSHYANLQMAIVQRVDLLKEYIMRPKRAQQQSSEKKQRVKP